MVSTLLYPEIKPYKHYFIDVDVPHSLYVEECGNPNGLPVIFIHGGPGAGCTEADRRFFDPAKYRVILFDQRGCGRSTPLAELSNNTTPHLIADIEKIRLQLGIDRWVVFGGSWGSTLSLAYTQTHPDVPLALIIRGIFMATSKELSHLNIMGMRAFYPEEFERFVNYLPEGKRENVFESYYELMTTGEFDTRADAAKEYSDWHMNGVCLNEIALGMEPDEDPQSILAATVIECHFMVNGCFFEPDQLLNNLAKIEHIPMTIIQGRYDLLCPPEAAWKLHKALPLSELHINQKAGHASRDPGNGDLLVEATDAVSLQFS